MIGARDIGHMITDKILENTASAMACIILEVVF